MRIEAIRQLRVGNLKRSSTVRVRDEVRVRRFAWQEGYGAFSVSRSNIPRVKRYIELQAEHHRERTFQEEFLQMLRKHGVEFDERHLW